MRYVLGILAAIAVLSVSTINAEARHKVHSIKSDRVIRDQHPVYAGQQFSAKRHYKHYAKVRHGNIQTTGYGGGYGPTYRPAGAHRAWCGDGSSIAAFGRMVPGLALASNWSRFPASAPCVGCAAWRHGHVKIITGVGPSGYTCYDPNSGGGVAHSGPCSIAGYHIVNPHGTAYASRETRTYHARSYAAPQQYAYNNDGAAGSYAH